mmetsp:Transcript_13187/g.18862  ORF Transcript_13187/g.18862 Transcript_13187/m.18862 type:complete len:124 (+) Transcript_13187:385-756(+)
MLQVHPCRIAIKMIAAIITQELAIYIGKSRNNVMFKGSAGGLISPNRIIKLIPKPDYIKIQITFGRYCHLYEGATNNMQVRTVRAITLRPSNKQGGYYFMSLELGQRAHGHQWYTLPKIDELI